MSTIENLRQYRVGEYAIFDLVVSFLGIYLLSPLLTKLFLLFKIKVPLISWMLFTLPLSILIHILFGRMTKMTLNFLDPNGHFLLKLFIVALVILGIINIKKL